MEWFSVYFIIWLSFSFIGWICEIIYCSIGDKKFVNRGFLNFPICPIYGFGGVGVSILLHKYRGNIIIVFILGMILTSLLEYITSYLLEKIFDIKLWDYSKYKYNINGRVTLVNSVIFGLMSVLVVEYIFHIVLSMVIKIPENIRAIITIIFIAILLVDFIITVYSIIKLNKRFIRLNYINEDINIREYIKESTSSIEIRLLRAFPDMKSKKHEEQLQIIKETFRAL